jgi:hypothetical protein
VIVPNRQYHTFSYETRVNYGIIKWKLHISESSYAMNRLVLSVSQIIARQLLYDPVKDLTILNQQSNAVFEMHILAYGSLRGGWTSGFSERWSQFLSNRISFAS